MLAATILPPIDPDARALDLPAGVFLVDGALDGRMTDVRISGKPGRTVLRRVPGGINAGIFHPDAGGYSGWQIDGVTIDGASGDGSVTALGGYTIWIVGGRGVRFERCTFINTIGPSTFWGTHGVRIRDCDFVGAPTGVMEPGTWDPQPVPRATYGLGVSIGAGTSDVLIEGSRFSFCQEGVIQAGNPLHPTDGLRIIDCDFRGDWWDTPLVRARPVITAFDSVSRLLTAEAGGFETIPRDEFAVVSLDVPVFRNYSLSRAYGAEVEIEGMGFDGARVGDVIETADGRRAEVTACVSASSVRVRSWESIADRTPVALPDSGVPWRLIRRYATSVRGISDTLVEVFGGFVAPIYGDRLAVDTGLTPVGCSCRLLAKLNYSGVHCNGGARGLQVRGSRVRGPWADGISIFDTPGARVVDNEVAYGQDEGVTLVRSPGAIASRNTFLQCGTSAVFLQSDRAVVCDNTILGGWGITNPLILGAIEGSGRQMVIQGNAIETPNGSPGGSSAYAIALRSGEAEGSVVSGNTGDGRNGTLYLDILAGSVAVRDVRSIAGPGASGASAGVGRTRP